MHLGWAVGVERCIARARSSQRVFHRMAHCLVHFAAVAKAHFNFGGVHVDVHPGGVNLNKQRINRLPVTVQHVFIGAAGSVGEHFVAHVAAVHVTKLLVST